MDLISPVLRQLVITFPRTLIWFVGIGLASLRLRELRFQMALLLMAGVGGTVLNLLLLITLQRGGTSVMQLGDVLDWAGVIRALLEGVAWGLLLVALSWRISETRLLSEGRA